MDKSTLRTMLIVVGSIMAYAANFIPNIFLFIIGMGLLLWGCYLWTRLKNRHLAFMLWGLLSPIGLLGISLLADKSWEEVARKPGEPTESTREEIIAKWRERTEQESEESKKQKK